MNNLINKTLEYKWIFIGAFIISIVYFIFPETVSAQSDDDSIFGAAVGFFLEPLAKGLIDILILLRKLTEYLLEYFQYLFIKSVEYTVFDFGALWGNDVLGTNLKVFWQIIRDILNLIIVVAFIVFAILTLFGEFLYKRKILFALLLAALFINFSAFFTLALIDFSNAMFTIIFNYANLANQDSFLLFSAYDNYLTAPNSFSYWNIFFQMIAVGLTLLIALAFFAITLFFLYRFIMAIILVITSPIFILGFVIKIFGGGENGLLKVLKYNLWKSSFEKVLISHIYLVFGLAIIFSVFKSFQNQFLDAPSVFAGAESFPLLAQISFISIAFSIAIFMLIKSIQRRENNLLFGPKINANDSIKWLGSSLKSGAKKITAPLRDYSRLGGLRLKHSLLKKAQSVPVVGGIRNVLGNMRVGGVKRAHKIDKEIGGLQHEYYTKEYNKEFNRLGGNRNNISEEEKWTTEGKARGNVESFLGKVSEIKKNNTILSGVGRLATNENNKFKGRKETWKKDLNGSHKEKDIKDTKDTMEEKWGKMKNEINKKEQEKERKIDREEKFKKILNSVNSVKGRVNHDGNITRKEVEKGIKDLKNDENTKFGNLDSNIKRGTQNLNKSLKGEINKKMKQEEEKSSINYDELGHGPKTTYKDSNQMQNYDKRKQYKINNDKRNPGKRKGSNEWRKGNAGKNPH